LLHPLARQCPGAAKQQNNTRSLALLQPKQIFDVVDLSFDH
jgi:hypothetical protein